MSHAQRLAYIGRITQQAREAAQQDKSEDDCPYESREIGDSAWYWIRAFRKAKGE
jgi:ribosome modulation factor